MLQGGLILLQAILIALLIRIALIDFRIQRITNRDVMALAGLGTARLALLCLQIDIWWPLLLAAIIGFVLLVALLPFWLLRKVGAGDVKLLAVSPLVAGGDNLLPFSFLLLIFATTVALLIKNPMLMPAPVFRQYLEHFERKGFVPFGVPISAALVGVELLRAVGFDLML
jgi:prepilin peptidase CpaA